MEPVYGKNNKEELPLEYYIERYKTTDAHEIAARCALPYDEETHTFTFPLLGDTYTISHPDFVVTGERTPTNTERILFLRRIMAEMPADPTPYYERTRVVGLNYNYDKYLLYYGIRQSGVKIVNLPAGAQYKAEWIDTWNMTVEPVDGVFSGEGARIPMPSRSYVALRLTRI